MPMELIPITPKRRILDADRVCRGLAQEMYRFVTKFKEKAATYPPDQPTVSGYRRTMALGRSFSSKVESRPGLIVGTVASDPTVMTGTPHTRRLKSGKMSKVWFPKKSYAPYVVGKKQSRVMASRGWKRLKDTLGQEWPGQVRRFQEVIGRLK